MKRNVEKEEEESFLLKKPRLIVEEDSEDEMGVEDTNVPLSSSELLDLDDEIVWCPKWELFEKVGDYKLFVDQTSKTEESSWFKYLPRSGSLPVFVAGSLYRELRRGALYPPKEEKRLITLYESPGVGKSSLLETAALLSKGTILKIPCSRDGASGAYGSLRKKMEGYGQHLEDKDILETAWRIYSNAALKHILEIAYNLKKNQPDTSNLGEILTNGVHFPDLPTFETIDKTQWSDDLATLKSLEREAQKGLDEIVTAFNSFPRTLIVFEDTQDWVSNTKPDYPKLKSIQKIEHSDARYHYQFLTFVNQASTCLTGVQIALTATHPIIRKLMKFDSGLKLFAPPARSFPMATPLLVTKVLKTMLTEDALNTIGKLNLERISKELTGPWRLLHYFCRDLLYVSDWKEALYLARQDFKDSYIDPVLEKIPDTLKASFFNEAAIALYILDCFGTRDDSGMKTYPVEGLGETFVRYAGEGVLRAAFTEHAAELTFQEPYPWLRRSILELSTVVHQQSFEEVYVQLRARHLDEEKGKGVCFQFFLALELLSNPASGLWVAISKQIPSFKRKKRYNSKIAFFETEKQAIRYTDEGCIAVSMDAHAKNVKIGDVAFNGKGPGGEKWHVRIEAKCYESDASVSVLRGMAVSFFTKILHSPTIDHGIFITKDAFDPFGTLAGTQQRALSNLVLNTEKRLGFISITKDIPENSLILDLNTLIRPSQNLTFSTLRKRLFRSDTFDQVQWQFDDNSANVHQSSGPTRSTQPEAIEIGVLWQGEEVGVICRDPTETFAAFLDRISREHKEDYSGVKVRKRGGRMMGLGALVLDFVKANDALELIKSG